MVVSTTLAGPPVTEYNGVFQSYVNRNSEVLARQLRSFDGLLSQELQARVWLTLSYGLRLNWAWPSTRDLLMMVAPKMEQGGMWDDWLPCLAQGIERSQDVGDQVAEAELSLHLGHLLSRLGDSAGARKWLEHAESLFTRQGLTRRRALALGRLANLAYRAEAAPEKARKLLDRAFAILRPDDPEAAFCWFVLGALTLAQHKQEEATGHFQRAQALAEQSGDQRLNALVLLNLGRVCQQRSLYEPAEQYFEWAISTFESLEDPVNLAVARLNLGILYMTVDHHRNALRCFEEAETTLKRCHGDRRYLAMLYNNKGMSYAALEDWHRAVQAYQASISLWRDLEEPLARLNVEDNLGSAYAAMGRLQEAGEIFVAALTELDQVRALAGNEAECALLQDELTTHLTTIDAAALPDAARALAFA